MVLPRRQLKPRTFRIGKGQVREAGWLNGMIVGCLVGWPAVGATGVLAPSATSFVLLQAPISPVFAPSLPPLNGPLLQTVMIGGLARVDVVDHPGATLYLNVFASDEVGCHLGKTEGADER